MCAACRAFDSRAVFYGWPDGGHVCSFVSAAHQHISSGSARPVSSKQWYYAILSPFHTYKVLYMFFTGIPNSSYFLLELLLSLVLSLCLFLSLHLFLSLFCYLFPSLCLCPSISLSLSLSLLILFFLSVSASLSCQFNSLCLVWSSHWRQPAGYFVLDNPL